MANRRYTCRLHTEGFKENDPIDIEALLWGDGSIGTWDNVESRFLTKEELQSPEIRRAIAKGL